MTALPPTDVFTWARLWFYERRPNPDGWQYQRINPSTPSMDGTLRTTMVPAVGDTFHLADQHDKERRGTFKVVSRDWAYPSFGSHDWPYVGGIVNGPIVTVIVERSEGPFVNQADGDGEDG